MGTQLLATKLFVPQSAPGLVARPRLLSRLDGILHNKLTLVSAQAGFGKTTLVVQWLHARRPPISTAWLSLEEADNEPVRFWEYVIAAIKTLSPDIGGQALVLLHSSQQVPIESTLTTLINDLVEVNADFILVLDDYQYIHNGDIHQGLDFLLSHLPPRMHLVITTRVDPPLSLAHYRGKGILLEVRADDLRFSTEDAASLLNDVASLELTVDDVNTLNNRAEGWAVGLKLVGLALQQQPDPRSFISGFTGTSRYIMDYLLDEVLKQQPREVYDFLLQTSVLERFNRSLCDAVTGTSSSQEMLLYLEKANLFIIPLDISGVWYRYHHLFRDLLCHRLQQEFGEEGVQSAYRRVGAWFETNKLIEEAINYFLAARNWDKAMVLIGTPEIQARWVGTSTMSHWLQQVPLELLHRHPLRYINYAHGLLSTGQQDAVRLHLEQLEKLAIDNTYLQGEVNLLHSAITLIDGDFPKVGEFALRALELFDENIKTHPDQAQTSTISVADASQKLGLVYFQQARFAEAEPLFELGYRTYREELRSFAVCFPATMYGAILASRGRPRDAIKVIQDTVSRFQGDPATSFAHGCFGVIYYYLNDLSAAAFHYEQEEKLIKFLKIVPTTTLTTLYLSLAQVRMALHDIEVSAKAMAEADRLMPNTPEDFARNAAFHAELAAFQGDAESAEKWYHQFFQFETVPLMDMPVAAIYKFQLHKGKANVLKIGQGYYEKIASQGFWQFAMISRIYQALACDNNLEQAVAYLAEALTMGKSQECIRTFIDFGAPMASLLQQAIAKGIELDYARKLLDIIEDDEHWRQSNRIKTRISSHTTGLLSEREIDVLRLLADGLTNQQISDKLTISLNTVKTHVYRVFEKLEAKHRGEAIARARQLKLI